MSLGVPSPWYGWVGRTISLVLHFMSSSLLLNYVASRLASLCTSLPTYSLSLCLIMKGVPPSSILKLNSRLS